MSLDNNTLEFKLGKDDWETYIQRLELRFDVKGIYDNYRKVTILLTLVNPDAYILIRDLCAPAKPAEKTYAEIVKLVSDHLCPKPTEAMERFKFHKAKQSRTESVAEFIARLRKMSLHCNFQNINDAIRDQLVCGIRDHDTKVLLFKEEGLTLHKAIRIATAQQNAKRNAQSVENVTEGTGYQSDPEIFVTRDDPGRRFQDGSGSSRDNQFRRLQNAETQRRPQRRSREGTLTTRRPANYKKALHSLLDRMTKAELKEQLDLRGLYLSGNKADLKYRLLDDLYGEFGGNAHKPALLDLLENMSIADLKEQLEKRHLSKAGNKDMLERRLLNALCGK